MRRFLHSNGLSLTMFGIFLLLLLGQSVAGHRTHNEERSSDNQPAIDYGEYLRSGHFIGATFENWESEYLQMAAYVLLTVFLFQRGSSESKDPDKEEPVDKDPALEKDNPESPWPVRKGGLVLSIYKYSLSLAMGLLFVISFALHLFGSVREYNREQAVQGLEKISAMEFARTSEFWFQSLQNWQSEFLAVGSIVVLSIFLRQYRSPESKPVAAPHSDTGNG